MVGEIRTFVKIYLQDFLPQKPKRSNETMNDDLFTASLIVVLAFADYALLLCIWHTINAYTDKFSPSEWIFDPGKPLSLGRFKLPL